MAQKVFLVDKHGEVVWPGERHTRQFPWVNVGSITAVVAAGQAPIDVDKRAHADIVALAAAKKAIYQPTNGTVALEYRFRSDGTENDALAVQMHAQARGAAGDIVDDYYTKIADLTVTQGAQAAGVGYFADAIAHTNRDWLTPLRHLAAQENYIARYILNTHGYTDFLFVCTDLKNATNLYIDARRM